MIFRFRPAIPLSFCVVRVLVALEWQNSCKAILGIDFGYVYDRCKTNSRNIGDLLRGIPLPTVLIEQEKQTPPIDDGAGNFPVQAIFLDYGDWTLSQSDLVFTSSFSYHIHQHFPIR